MKNETNSATWRKYGLIALALLLVSVAGWWFVRGNRRQTQAGRPVPAPDFVAFPDAQPAAKDMAMALRPDDVLLTLSPDKLANAQLKIEAATVAQAANPAGGLRTTGMVQANAYKETPVLPLAGGVVREVRVVLGDRVQAGQTLATLFSTDLSEAQTVYLSMQAEIEKHHKHYHRATELVEMGAISREEFEESAAALKTEEAKLAAARQRLLWLGMTAKQLDELRAPNQMSATVPVTAPAAGTIISRSVNVGEVIASGKELFRLADLSVVWVIGQLYEQDFAAARMGTPAVITTPAYPQRTFTGRVAYLDPRIEPQSRTAQVRIEIRNPNELLKLGMFVDVNFGGAATSNARASANVPRAAVQFIGAKQVVFVETAQPGVFAQRTVQAGSEANGLTPIYAGLNLGERVVTEGSFLLRAESLKLNPAQLTAPAKTAASDSPAPFAENPREQTARITLNEQGYQPASVKLRAGIPTRLTFVRQVEATCGTEIVLADYGIKKDLPLREPVTIEFTPAKSGEFSFACGMNMLKGKLIVRE